MCPSKGETTAPWGVPTFVSFHSPSSDTPAFSHFWIRRITRRSAIRCSTNFTSHSCDTLSKETTMKLGVSRQTVLQRVKRGELEAVLVRQGRRKGLRIKVVDQQPELFEELS